MAPLHGGSPNATVIEWAPGYRRLDPFPAESEMSAAWHSSATADPLWDDFLRGTPRGQYQQSSLWAEYKATEGWTPHRIILTGPGGIVGGFQILWKKTRLGRIGYLSKGPVAHPESAVLVRQLGALLVDVAGKLRLTALNVQLPDETRIETGLAAETGGIRSNPMGVIEATYLVDVRPEMEVLRSKMSPSLRRNIRRAKKERMVVREGTAADIPRFFQLMAATCQRQETAPNPPSEEAVRRLWEIFSPTKSIRMTFAECGDGSPAAKLCLHFGDRVTLWKKGWDGSLGQLHPNELLEDEALEWAHAHGYRICDFCSLDRIAAARILGGKPAVGESLSSRDEYHLRFGGFPQLLPPSLMLIPNPLLRWGFRNVYARLERRRHRRRTASEG